MGQHYGSPLDELSEKTLFKLLGDAWYAQFKQDNDKAYFHPAAADVGKREYSALLPKLRDDLAQPYGYGAVACVTKTIRRSGAWRMPAMLVAAIAAKQNLVPSNRISKSGHAGANSRESRQSVDLPLKDVCFESEAA